jgi:hypothetical protein
MYRPSRPPRPPPAPVPHERVVPAARQPRTHTHSHAPSRARSSGGTNERSRVSSVFPHPGTTSSSPRTARTSRPSPLPAPRPTRPQTPPQPGLAHHPPLHPLARRLPCALCLPLHRARGPPARRPPLRPGPRRPCLRRGRRGRAHGRRPCLGRAGCRVGGAGPHSAGCEAAVGWFLVVAGRHVPAHPSHGYRPLVV